MITQSLDNLNNRMSSEETEASLAIYDMCATGALYQNQSDFDYYSVSRETGNVTKLNRWTSKFEKQKGIAFKFMYSTKWKKIND